MKKEEMVQKAYDMARERYLAVGVDTDKALDELQRLSISIHCWQADDVTGFEALENLGGGGIQATGNYPGRARNVDEVRQDIDKVLTLVAGRHRLSLHAIYGEFGGKAVDRDEIEPAHFTGWTQLPELTSSTRNVSICAPGEAGNQAYVIRSQRNPYELFVVEMRRQTSLYSDDTLDSRVGGTGLIVYRVDTTVDGLSNYFGSTGVYVFRPQPGQNGYAEGSERATVGNAFLSAESVRTSIGSADPNAGLAQGALTFSDGTNSGIVISDVSSAQNGSMTFSVTIKAEELPYHYDITYASAMPRPMHVIAPDCDVEVHFGGQPIYYYVASVE